MTATGQRRPRNSWASRVRTRLVWDAGLGNWVRRLVGHTTMDQIARTYYHVDLDTVSDKMKSFRVLQPKKEEEEDAATA